MGRYKKCSLHKKKLREYYKKYNIKFYYTPAHKAQRIQKKDKEKYDRYGNYMADHFVVCLSKTKS